MPAATLPPLDFDLSSIKDLLAKMRGGVSAASDVGTLANAGRAAVPTAPVTAGGAVNYAALDTPTIMRQAQQAVAGSVPIGENVAPLATSEAASASTIGQRALAAGARFGGLRSAASLLGRVSLPFAAADFGTRAGELLTPDKVAVGLADMAGRLGNFLGIKNSYGNGVEAYSTAQGLPDVQKGPVAAAPAAPATPADRFPVNGSITGLSPEDAAAAGAKFFQGSAVPADGTGYVRNESTGHVTAIDTRGQPRTVVRAGQPAPAAAASPIPQLGGEGGVFSNLANFTNDFSRYALTRADAAGRTKLANASTEVATKRNDSIANRESQAQNAQSNALKAYADVLKETTAANKENVKTIVGLDGNPIIVDQKAQTAKKVVPTEKPTVDKFLTEARKDPRNKGFTDAQLKAYYAKTYGG